MATVVIEHVVAGTASSAASVPLTLTDGTPVKVKLITGTTGSSEGDNSDTALGVIDPDKIISVAGLVNYSGTNYITNGYTKTSEYNFSAYISGTNIRLGLHPTSSGSLTSKPYKITVTYYE